MNNHKPRVEQFMRAREKIEKKNNKQSFAEQEVPLLMQRMNIMVIVINILLIINNNYSRLIEQSLLRGQLTMFTTRSSGGTKGHSRWRIIDLGGFKREKVVRVFQINQFF